MKTKQSKVISEPENLRKTGDSKDLAQGLGVCVWGDLSMLGLVDTLHLIIWSVEL